MKVARWLCLRPEPTGRRLERTDALLREVRQRAEPALDLVPLAVDVELPVTQRPREQQPCQLRGRRRLKCILLRHDRAPRRAEKMEALVAAEDGIRHRLQLGDIVADGEQPRCRSVGGRGSLRHAGADLADGEQERASEAGAS
jgi:hypothetical protein